MLKGKGCLTGKNCLAAAAVLALAQVGLAQVDGTLGTGEYGAPLVLQTQATGFGDNFSELNALYVRHLNNGGVQIMITGNLESNNNGLVMMFDANADGSVASTLPGGQGVLGALPSGAFDGRIAQLGTDTDNSAGVAAPAGGPSVLSAGFNPERGIEFNNGFNGADNEMYLNVADLRLGNDPPLAGNDNRFIFVPDASTTRTGLVGTPSLGLVYNREAGTVPSGTLDVALNNTNTLGIPGRPTPINPGDQLTATTGFEAAFSAQFLDADPGQEVGFWAYVTSGSGDFASNQFLPGLPGDQDNLGGPGDPGGAPMYDATVFEALDPNYRTFITLGLPEWNGSTSGDGSNDANWTRANPNGANTTAVFGALGAAQSNVNVNARTLGGLKFTGGAYNLSGGQIDLATFGRDARIIVSSGQHSVTNTVVANANVTADIASASSVAMTALNSGASGQSLTKIGDGALIVQNGLQFDTLNVNAGTIRSGGPSKTKALNIAGGSTPTARYDVDDSGIAIDYDAPTPGSPIATVREQIIDGRNGGNWNGAGITSVQASLNAGTTAVGYAEATEAALGAGNTFLGLPVDDSAVLVRYTRLGDADLSGTTDIDDFGRLAANFNGTDTGWSKGDFNYSGGTDIDDFGLLAANFNLGVAGLAGRPAAVPEPASMGLLALAALAAGRRRRA